MRNYLSRNYSFHFTIYTGAGNPELVSIIEGLWAQTGPFLASGVKDLGIEADWRYPARPHRPGDPRPRRRQGARADRGRHQLGHPGLSGPGTALEDQIRAASLRTSQKETALLRSR